VTSKATPATIGGCTEAVGVQLLSFGEQLVSSLAAGHERKDKWKVLRLGVLRTSTYYKKIKDKLNK
jgi:hypothetical protein